MIVPFEGSTTPRCQVCGNPLRGKSFKWMIRNKASRVCQVCDSSLKEQAGKTATGRHAEFRQVQESSGIGVIIVLVVIVFSLLIFYFIGA